MGGEISCTDTNKDKSVCTFTCDAGFVIDGDARATCDVTKGWDNPMPKCDAISPVVCPVLHNPSNGIISFCTDGFNEDSSCSFICSVGYSMIGGANLTCMSPTSGDQSSQNATGQWDFDEPTCRRIVCPELKTPINGHEPNCQYKSSYDYTPYYGTVCSFTCNTGYIISNSSLLSCTDGGYTRGGVGVWSHKEPTCDAIACPSLPPLKNGEISCDEGYNYGSTCTYTCATGYGIVGDGYYGENIKCTADYSSKVGNWTIPPLKCERLQCSKLPSHSKETTTVDCTDDNYYGSVCVFACKTGYVLSSHSSTIQCKGGPAQWQPDIPSCIPITCPSISSPSYSGLTNCTDSFNYGSVCSFNCISGYETVGHSSVTCSKSGEWDYPVPQCKAVTCKALSNPQHGRLLNCDSQQDRDDQYGSICSFQCNEGYVMYGSSTGSCKMDGNWSSQAPRCEAITCGFPIPSPLHGEIVDVTDQNNCGSIVSFICARGYTMFGSGNTTCTGDGSDIIGSWSFPEPLCVDLK